MNDAEKIGEYAEKIRASGFSTAMTPERLAAFWLRIEKRDGKTMQVCFDEWFSAHQSGRIEIFF